MSRSLELTPSQIKAYENGATMFIVPFNWEYKNNSDYMKKLIEAHAPIKKGDKDIFIKEEFADFGECKEDESWIRLAYKSDYAEYKNIKELLEKGINWQPASKMTKEQSRYAISECIDVRVVRVQDIENDKIYDIFPKIADDYECDNGEHENNVFKWFENEHNTQLKEANINRTYEDNDYVFLIEVKR